MAIRFNCSKCSAVLQVDDQYAGKSARCPTCQTVLTVPIAVDAGDTSAAPPRPDGPSSSPGPAGFGQVPANPYSPAVQTDFPSSGTAGAAQPRHVPIGAVFNHAAVVWKERLGILVGATVISFAVSFVFSAVSGTLEGIGRENDAPALLLVSSVVNILGSLVNLFVGIGMARICLATARRQAFEISLLFSGSDKFLPVLGATFLMGIASVVAFLLLIVPLILLWMFFWPFYYLIVDRQCGAMDSFSRGLEIAKPNAGTTFLLMVSSVLIFLAGLIALCVGVLFAAPFIGVLWATAYLMMKGELATDGGSRFAAM